MDFRASADKRSEVEKYQYIDYRGRWLSIVKIALVMHRSEKSAMSVQRFELLAGALGVTRSSYTGPGMTEYSSQSGGRPDSELTTPTSGPGYGPGLLRDGSYRCTYQWVPTPFRIELALTRMFLGTRRDVDQAASTAGMLRALFDPLPGVPLVVSSLGMWRR